MNEQQQNGAQPDGKQASAYPDRVDNIRRIFLEAIKPLSGDLNSEEVLFFVEKSFDLGLEALALKSEAIQQGALIVQQQIMQQAYDQELMRKRKEQSADTNNSQDPQEPTQNGGSRGGYL